MLFGMGCCLGRAGVAAVGLAIRRGGGVRVKPQMKVSFV